MASIYLCTPYLVASIMAAIGDLLDEAHELLLALNRSGPRIGRDAKGYAG